MKASELMNVLSHLMNDFGDLEVINANTELPVEEVSYETTERTDAAFFLE